jgi:hypothetical protein
MPDQMTTAERTHFICQGAERYARFVLYAPGNDMLRQKFREQAKREWSEWQLQATPEEVKVARALTMTAREFSV